MMREEYASIRATPSLVGREDILTQVHGAIQDQSPVPQVFYITAPGGWGKTRLVDAILKELDAGEWASHKILSASRLVDLYHTYTHSDEGLVDDIVNVLDVENGGRFENYINQRAELDRVKHDLSQILRTVTQQRTKMMDAFIEDFNNNSNHYEKVVLAFDTVENLTYEPDRVQIALGLAEEPIGVAGWLVRGFLPKIRNAVVLIAGRPETPQLEVELEKLNKDKTIVLDHIKLQTFSEEETLAYFEAVLTVVREENPQIAVRLERISQETRLVVHYLSGGEPFFLSLFVDYLVMAEELLSILHTPLEEVKKKSLINNGLQRERDEFREAILQEFQRSRRPIDNVIRTLAWTEKGMGAVLLAWILKRGHPTEEEIEQAKKYIGELRNPEFRLSFVKIREIDSLVFLQDEMYKLMRSLHQRGRMRHNAKQTYELIVRFYEEQIKEQARVVNELDKSTRSLFSSGTWKEFTEAKKLEFLSEQRMLREARARLQGYQVEHVYYSLQAGFLQGIQAYYRTAEGAFQGNDTDLWLLLRDELLRFARPSRFHENENDALKYIDGDIGVRWIKSNIANGQYDKAFEQIERFRRTCSDLVGEGSFADLSLKIWESWALIYSGKEYKKAKHILDGVIASLNSGLTDKLESEFDQWRSELLAAYAQDITGYMYRSQGDFAKAVEYYQKNIRLWKKLEIRSELANTLSNLSWVLAEVGDFQSAITYCEDGLNLRRLLGHRYPIALSLNTLGLIETRNGQPERARFRCEQALAIFHDLEQPRGIGLACTALAESLRRMVGVSDLLTRDHILESLKLAEQYALEAVGVFTDVVKERLRLVEAYIELGCVYREIARWKKMGGDDIGDFVERSRSAFDLAVENAGAEFSYRRVDALVNMAWTDYYLADFEQAEKTVIRALSMIEQFYFFTEKKEPFINNETVPSLWSQLGEAYLLLGRISFSKYEQALEQKNAQDVESKLKEMAQNWTLSLAYNGKYGKGGRDATGWRKVIYNSLSGLNTAEMFWVREGINITYKKFFASEDLKFFESFVNELF